MKKTIAFIIIMAVFTLITSDVSAGATDDPTWYISGMYGQSGDSSLDSEDFDETINYDSDSTIGIAVGGINQIGRVEFEISHQTGSLTSLDTYGIELDFKGDLTITSYMLNIYGDFRSKKRIMPYLGCGLGISNIAIDVNKFIGLEISDMDDSASTLALQAMGGIGIKVIDNVIVDIQYRYFKAFNAELFDAKYSTSNNNFLIGVRINF